MFGAGLNKLAQQLDGGAAVCSDPRQATARSLRRSASDGSYFVAQHHFELCLDDLF